MSGVELQAAEDAAEGIPPADVKVGLSNLNSNLNGLDNTQAFKRARPKVLGGSPRVDLLLLCLAVAPDARRSSCSATPPSARASSWNAT